MNVAAHRQRLSRLCCRDCMIGCSVVPWSPQRHVGVVTITAVCTLVKLWVMFRVVRAGLIGSGGHRILFVWLPFVDWHGCSVVLSARPGTFVLTHAKQCTKVRALPGSTVFCIGTRAQHCAGGSVSVTPLRFCSAKLGKLPSFCCYNLPSASLASDWRS